jgi:formimidoylglutamate deiminase
MPPPRICLEFEHLHQPEGWLSPGFVEVDAAGAIVRVNAVRPRDWPGDPVVVRGFAIPGMPNVHSHAFQRAMAGFAEHRGHPTDTFWTWCETMYSFASALQPETLEDLTAMAFLEMVKAGFTSVGEFHYIHRDPQGRPYAHAAEMSWRVCAAAEREGLGLTLLPVLYHIGRAHD